MIFQKKFAVWALAATILMQSGHLCPVLAAPSLSAIESPFFTEILLDTEAGSRLAGMILGTDFLPGQVDRAVLSQVHGRLNLPEYAPLRDELDRRLLTAERVYHEQYGYRDIVELDAIGSRFTNALIDDCLRGSASGDYRPLLEFVPSEVQVENLARSKESFLGATQSQSPEIHISKRQFDYAPRIFSQIAERDVTQVLTEYKTETLALDEESASRELQKSRLSWIPVGTEGFEYNGARIKPIRELEYSEDVGNGPITRLSFGMLHPSGVVERYIGFEKVYQWDSKLQTRLEIKDIQCLWKSSERKLMLRLEILRSDTGAKFYRYASIRLFQLEPVRPFLY